MSNGMIKDKNKNISKDGKQKTLLNGNNEVISLKKLKSVKDLDFNDEKVLKFMIKENVYDFINAKEEYGLDVVSMFENGMHNYLSDALNLYEKARISFHTRINLKDTRTCFHTLKGNYA